jgi:predicted RNA binding protein YcfA (HicA-like mRNA interferase family)
MASAHELARGRERLRALIEFALGEGWRVVRTSGGHLKFTKPAARRSTPARRRATTVPTAMPAPNFAAPTGRRRRRAKWLS